MENTSALVRAVLISAAALFVLSTVVRGAPLATYSAGNVGAAPDPTSVGWQRSTDFLFTTGEFAGQTRPPEEGTYSAASAGPPTAWEIYDVADNGDDGDGMKSAAEYYFQNIGDQSGANWTLSFDVSVRSDGAANPNKFKPNQGSLATNVVHYQMPYFDNGLRFKFWRVELAATDNGDGTFDLWALGREVAGGPPNFVRGQHALLLNDVSQSIAQAFYHYEMRYDAELGTATLWFDSGTGLATTAASNFVGDASGTPHDIDSLEDASVAFGTFTDAGAGHLLVRSLSFELNDLVDTGDFNLDGRVDGQDFLLWQRRDPGSDGNHDSQIDGEDLALWRQRFGGSNVTSNPFSASVPEPGAAMLLMASVFFVVNTARRQAQER